MINHGTYILPHGPIANPAQNRRSARNGLSPSRLSRAGSHAQPRATYIPSMPSQVHLHQLHDTIYPCIPLSNRGQLLLSIDKENLATKN